MDTLLFWIGGTPARYWVVSAVAGGLLIVAAWESKRIRSWLFLAALGLCLLALRWPIAVLNSELAVDESQVVAGAMKLAAYPIAWKHVDLNTIGPLNAYALSLCGWLGLPINYTVTHFVALAMVWVAVASGYLLLRTSCDERLARVAILPAAAFFSLANFSDFVHYTSEHVPLALLGVGSACLWRAVGSGSVTGVFLGTAALGAVPWAKLQGTPVALWFALFGGGMLAWRWWGEPAKRWRLLGAWLAGGCAVSAGFALMLIIWGLVRQWRTAYIQQALVYAGMGRPSLAETLCTFAESGENALGFNAFFWPLMAAGFTVGGALLFGARRNVALPVFLAGAVVMSLYAIAAPGRIFYHYLLFLVMPATLLVGALFSAALESSGPDMRPRSRAFKNVAMVIFLAICIAPQIAARRLRTLSFIPYNSSYAQLHQGEVAKILARTAHPGDTLTVWGWTPRLYVESRLLQATRDGQTERQIVDTPLREFYRGRYLFDLRRYRPRFFVDAVGPGHWAFGDRAADGYETWPELKEFVDEQYELIAEADNCRIFASRSVAGQATPAPEAGGSRIDPISGAIPSAEQKP